MCFQLYAGTNQPMPRSGWDKNDPHVNVRDLAGPDSWTRSVFSKREVQYIGSSSCCGCAFPSAMHQNGDWPYWLDPVRDADVIASDKRECEELCQILSQLDEDEIELYGVWAGSENKGPLVREELHSPILVENIFASKKAGLSG